MLLTHSTFHKAVWAVAPLLLLAACSSTRLDTPAPVEERGTGSARPTPVAVEPSNPAPLVGAENAGKPGYYTVKAGDTLIRIGLDNGQSWRDVARWNNLENPNRIEVGQVLRVQPPQTAVVVAATPDNGVVTRPVTSATVTPVVPGTPASAAVSPASPASATAPVTARAASAPSTTPVAVASAPGSSDENLAWIWPTTGAVTRNFEEPSNNGIDVGGKLGTPVVAAMDGRVVYVGSAIRGLGNLVVIKHNATYMSAYAHNQTIVVREDQLVSKGQKIAEMGSSDTDKVKLHFEIRRMGKPMDPLKYLPAR